jgi:hypothetical protein
MKFAIKWEIKDETVLKTAYYAMCKYKGGELSLNETENPIEMAVEVLLYMDYWTKVFQRSIQFCDIGLVMCGYNDNW